MSLGCSSTHPADDDTPLAPELHGRAYPWDRDADADAQGLGQPQKGAKPAWGALRHPQALPKWAAGLSPSPPQRQDTLDPGWPELCFVKGSKQASEFLREISSLDGVGVKFIFLKRYRVFRSNKALVC